MRAVRNITLCTKDCLCLLVCPTGATDTEDGQIDAGKCLDGCRLCVDACPSHAISLLPSHYPEPIPTSDEVSQGLINISLSKAKQALYTEAFKDKTEIFDKNLLDAIARSNERMAEDLVREAGFMLPQASKTIEFLQALKKTYSKDPAFPKEDLNRLITLLTHK